jgi:4-alpha-glucanotransferase
MPPKARTQSRPDPFARRRAGLLLHPTSLPGPGDHGIIGHEAFRLVEWMEGAGLSVWQTLPLSPTHDDGSPYHALSAHAVDPALISLDWLRDRHLLDEDEVRLPRTEAMRLAHDRFHLKPPREMAAELKAFTVAHKHWLPDYALYMAIREAQSHKPWHRWPAALRDRKPEALKRFEAEHQHSIDFHRFGQYIAYAQWLQLKAYANQHGVLMFGDIPIYVALDSADVWANRELFQLDRQGKPVSVAGVPPDYFSDTGQRWGNPLYDWQAMQKDRFQWWRERIQSQLDMFDLIRIDHFRGLEAYWEIPATCKTAIDGKWVEAPGEALLKQLQKHFGRLPLVAEDLGVITDEVEQLRDEFTLPGMKILQFAFDGDPHNAYLPHNQPPLAVVYTGTHDNDTTESWFAGLDPNTMQYIDDYLGPGYPDETISRRMVRSALASPARLAMLPMQDLLGLGKGNRMNTPGTSKGNWGWRFEWEQVEEEIAPGIRHLIQLYGRLAKIE